MSPEISKPEWFQMAEEDGFAPKPTIARTVRILALTTPLLVLGAGLVFAQTQNSPTATAGTKVVSSASTTAPTDPISLSTTPSPTAPLPTAASTPANNTIQVSHAVATTQKTSITIKKPAITKPTGGGDDGAPRTGDDD